MSELMNTSVSVLGAGLMGSAIARALLRAGHSVTVWNRTAAKADALRGDGANVAQSAVEAMNASPLSIFVFKSYDAVNKLLDQAASTDFSGDVINLVTGQPEDADRVEHWATRHDVRLLDGAILAFPNDIGTEDAAIYFSGDPGVWEQWESVVRGLAGGSLYLGNQMRLANSIDTVTLSLVTAAECAILETLAYGQALGLPLSVLWDTISQVPAALENFISYAVRKIEASDYTTSDASIDTWVMSSRQIAEHVDRMGIRGHQIKAAAASLRAAQDAGLGALDLLALHQIADHR
ncbi:FAD-dependent oxidoreductase [Nocardioides sp. CER19]|uniref:NAD(P)-dependent oxidoreductase n=1 Tax=Nocardioides sp. CER19 TaxID=3038538 RepID=UPI002449811A|nr:FAD-dependent oxidoreductase [Nocardioides sp. CER19]MDH2416152.1 NAD(P)-binding domain-containing protein [Nocardioides sp. CER19]